MRISNEELDRMIEQARPTVEKYAHYDFSLQIQNSDCWTLLTKAQKKRVLNFLKLPTTLFHGYNSVWGN